MTSVSVPIPLYGAVTCLVCGRWGDFMIDRVVLHNAHTKGGFRRCPLPPLDSDHPQFYRRAKAS